MPCGDCGCVVSFPPSETKLTARKISDETICERRGNGAGCDLKPQKTSVAAG
jgi:hypothetical protein